MSFLRGVFVGLTCLPATMVLSLMVLSFGPPRALGETVRFAHCVGGCPTGTPAGNQVVARSLYTLSYNPDNKVADWVAYIVTSDSIGVATNLSRAPSKDPFIADTLQPEDFLAVEEGDQLALSSFAPLVSFAGTPFWTETNFLTNMVPRNSELNRGSWYGLEWAVRNYASRSEGLYIITGPVYSSELIAEQTLATNFPHRVPTGFFKVVVNSEGQMAAFTFPQDLPFHIHHCERRSSLEEVERLTGLDLFPELPQWPLGDLGESLGCFNQF